MSAISVTNNWLVTFLSMEGLIQHKALQFIANCALMLRCVNRGCKAALESNKDLAVNIFLTASGMEELTYEFLVGWSGNLSIFCEEFSHPTSPWICSFTDSLGSTRRINYQQLQLKVKGRMYKPLIDKLTEPRIDSPVLKAFTIAFEGNFDELVAAQPRMARLRTMAQFIDLSLIARDSKAPQVSDFLKYCQDENVELTHLSLR